MLAYSMVCRITRVLHVIVIEASARISVSQMKTAQLRSWPIIIGACKPGPTRALPGLIMLLVVLALSKLGFTIVENQIN